MIKSTIANMKIDNKNNAPFMARAFRPNGSTGGEDRLLLAVLCLAFIILGATIAPAQTIVSGKVMGTWVRERAPYILQESVTVQANEVLTILPGVAVIIPANSRIIVHGTLHAVGKPNWEITFSTPDLEAAPWNGIEFRGNTKDCRMEYCRVRKATRGVTLYSSRADNVSTAIYNCSFDECVDGIFVHAQGSGGLNPCWGASPTVSVDVRNSVFRSLVNGIVLNGQGVYHQGWFCGGGGNGRATGTFKNNIFDNLSGTALIMQNPSRAAGAVPSFVNNTVVNCGKGVSFEAPFDPTIVNNIFMSCRVGVERTGNLGTRLYYNNFYDNEQDFGGYPTSSYGNAILLNRNRVECDLSFNIFSDPKFEDDENYKLSPSSACVDAGHSELRYRDAIHGEAGTVSFGEKWNDLGAWGGADACNWITEISTTAPPVFMKREEGKVVIYWLAIPRANYKVQGWMTPKTGNANEFSWVDLEDGSVRELDTVARYILEPSASIGLFRVVNH